MSKSGAELITEERHRQLSEEGWTAEHDSQHMKGELAIAGACYALDYVAESADPTAEGCYQVGNDFWPWKGGTFKTTPDDPVRQLTKAGALIAAEIDRINHSSKNAEVKE